ncbi:MAG: signal recognition particle protein [Pseudomonadota bacterium]
MFDHLADSLSNVFSKLGKQKSLTEENVAVALREVRRSLLEADVALPVVRDLVEAVRDKAVGLDVIKDIDPSQQVVKIVHDELISLLSGGESSDQETQLLDIQGRKLSVIMTLGLQGSGKTTSAGKLAKRLKEYEGKKVFLASLDDRRPAAQEQLKILGDKIDVESLPIISGQGAIDIAKRAMATAEAGDYDVVILDTAGRMTADQDLMAEIKEITSIAKPHETLLVADSLTGQDAVQTAEAFHEHVGITGIILTRIDGDGRGGAALSMRAVTGKAVKFMGVGEDISAFEEFHPERIAGRILGMGDVVSLVEKAVSNIDENEALSMIEKFKKGIFDFDDLLMQMKQMQNLGGMGGVMNLLPGMRKIKKQIEDSDIDDKVIKSQEAIIRSMTKKERKNPSLVNHASRKKRIAKGAGVSVSDVNKLVQMQKQMAKMMAEMQKVQEGKGGKVGRLMKNLLGGGLDAGMPSEDELKSMAQKMRMGGGMPGMAPGQMPGMNLFGKTKTKKKKPRVRLR